jgi:hypothetical protein
MNSKPVMPTGWQAASDIKPVQAVTTTVKSDPAPKTEFKTTKLPLENLSAARSDESEFSDDHHLGSRNELRDLMGFYEDARFWGR